ncbi:hypothetical protein [Actinokineospora sp. HUAS TT18]|uniref:hypothetical protein n=1 Tax=Actinokineospora sp. HUAS TT18 TaxID=3447451 RepID=UPI003F520831
MTYTQHAPPLTTMSEATATAAGHAPRADRAAARLAERAMPDPPAVAEDALRIRVAPYDYSGRNNGNANIWPDHGTGKISIGGKSGHVDGGLSGRVSGIAWVGTTLWFPQSAQTVRAAPVISWKAGWTLWTAGIGSPRASARGGVQLQAYDEHGPVSDLAQHELFNQDHSESGFGSENDGWDDGMSTHTEVVFDVPAGAPRWLNVLAYLDMNADYSSVINVAAAQAGIDVHVRWIVLDPL